MLNPRKKSLVILFILCLGTLLPAQRRYVVKAEHCLVKCKLLINPATNEQIPNAAIEMINGRILRVYKNPKEIPVNTPGVKIYDFKDNFIIPGLIDTHGHLFTSLSKWRPVNQDLSWFYVTSGVTTVRSPGSFNPGGALAYRDLINGSYTSGPRYYFSGPYLQGKEKKGGMMPMTTPEEVCLKIDYWIKAGATSVKVYDRMEGEVLRTAILHAHRHGLKILGHIMATTYQEAIDMGIDEIFHGFCVFPDILPEDIRKKDSKAQDKYMLSLKLTNDIKKKTREILRSAANSRVVITPTLGIFEPVEIIKTWQEKYKEYYSKEGYQELDKVNKWFAKMSNENVFKNALWFVKVAHEEGCILTTGTDFSGLNIPPGFSLWREMELFSKAGIPPMDVLKAATCNGAYAIGISDMVGSIEPGKLSDMVVLDKNPLENISNIRTVHRVINRGILRNPKNILKYQKGKLY